MSMTLTPRGLALAAALSFGLAAPALAAAPGAMPATTPAPAATTSGQPSAPGAVTATTPQNAGSAQVAQADGNDGETADEGPGQQHHGNGPDNEQEGEQSN